MLLGLALAITSCTLQLGYSASSVLLSAQANDRYNMPWLHPVSDVAQTLVPRGIVDPVLLEPSPPTAKDARSISLHDFVHFANTTDADNPVYVGVWFIFNAVVTNILGFLALFFLLTVDIVRAWEGLSQGFTCCPYGKEACSRPVLDMLQLARYKTTKIHAIYNIVAEGISHVATLPQVCPVPCHPVVTVSYLGTLGLVISAMKAVEAVIHKISISIREIRTQGSNAWNLCDGDANARAMMRSEKVVRLMQISMCIAERSESAVQFVKTYYPLLSENSMLGVSLSIPAATFPLQPFGLGLAVTGLAIQNLLPKLEADVSALLPQELVEAGQIQKEDQFFFWISEQGYEIQGWMLKIREMEDKVDAVKTKVSRVKMVLNQVMGGGPLACEGVDVARLFEVMKIVDPMMDMLQAQAAEFVGKLHGLRDLLRDYLDQKDDPADERVQGLIRQIRASLPKKLLSDFMQTAPASLLGRLLELMEASKAAGAAELELQEGGRQTFDLEPGTPQHAELDPVPEPSPAPTPAPRSELRPQTLAAEDTPEKSDAAPRRGCLWGCSRSRSKPNGDGRATLLTNQRYELLQTSPTK